MEKNFSELEAFLNGLAGEVVAIVPNVRKTTLAQIYGATRKIDFLLIVERVWSRLVPNTSARRTDKLMRSALRDAPVLLPRRAARTPSKGHTDNQIGRQSIP